MATGIYKTENGRYQACVYDHNANDGKGGKIRKTFDTVSAAKQWRADAISAIGKGTLSADRGPTLKGAAGEWLVAARAGHARNRSGDEYKPAAIRGYEKELRLRVLPEFGSVRVGDIRRPHVQALADRLVAAGKSASTVQCTIVALRAVFRYARRRNWMHTDPAHGLELPAIRSAEREGVLPEEVERRLALLPADTRVLWAVAFYAGLRRGELAALMWEDIDLATGVIRVRRGWDAIEGEITPKSRNGVRKVPITPQLRDYLDQHKLDSTTDRVFGSLRNVRTMADRASKAWAKAKLERLTLHGARHAYASLMIAAGVNAKALSTFMGHSSIQVTYDKYGHLMPGSEDEAADLLAQYLARGASPISSPEPGNVAA